MQCSVALAYKLGIFRQTYILRVSGHLSNYFVKFLLNF